MQNLDVEEHHAPGTRYSDIINRKISELPTALQNKVRTFVVFFNILSCVLLMGCISQENVRIALNLHAHCP